MQSCIAKLQEIISRLKRNKSRKTSPRGGIAIPIHQINKHPKTEPRMFVLALRALKLVYKWSTIKNFAVTENYTTIEGSYEYQGQTWLSKRHKPGFRTSLFFPSGDFPKQISWKDKISLRQRSKPVHVFQKLLNQEKADIQTGTNSKSKYVTTRIPRYRGKASTNSSSNGRNPPAETPELLVKAVSFISDQLRMVPKMFHPMARRDFYSDRNVQESSAEQRS